MKKVDCTKILREQPFNIGEGGNLAGDSEKNPTLPRAYKIHSPPPRAHILYHT